MSFRGGGDPETFFTVWTNVFERGHLAAGERCWSTADRAASTTAIQLGRAFGARVRDRGIGGEVRGVRRAGRGTRDQYHESDFVAVFREATADRGVDVILDMVGGDYIARDMELLALEGRLVQIATQGGTKAQINLTRLLHRRLTITGSTLRVRTVAQKGAIAASLREQVWPLLESGRVGPVVHATFPLRAAADAHRVMDAGTHIGKLVLIND